MQSWRLALHHWRLIPILVGIDLDLQLIDPRRILGQYNNSLGYHNNTGRVYTSWKVHANTLGLQYGKGKSQMASLDEIRFIAILQVIRSPSMWLILAIIFPRHYSTTIIFQWQHGEWTSWTHKSSEIFSSGAKPLDSTLRKDTCWGMSCRWAEYILSSFTSPKRGNVNF